MKGENVRREKIEMDTKHTTPPVIGVLVAIIAIFLFFWTWKREKRGEERDDRRGERKERDRREERNEVVQVMVELSNNEQPMRKFEQSFMLAPKDTVALKCYVHNDAFHYLDSDTECPESSEAFASVEQNEERLLSDMSQSEFSHVHGQTVCSEKILAAEEEEDEANRPLRSDATSEAKGAQEEVESTLVELNENTLLEPQPDVEPKEENQALSAPEANGLVPWAAITSKNLPLSAALKPTTTQKPDGLRPVLRGPRPVREEKKEAQAWGVRYPDTHQLFVGNIPHDVLKGELKEVFEQYGTVMKVSIKNGGKVLNFGFVAFNDPSSVQNTLRKRPILIRGDWRLNVEEMARSRSKKAATSAILEPEPEGPKAVQPAVMEMKADNLLETQLPKDPASNTESASTASVVSVPPASEVNIPVTPARHLSPGGAVRSLAQRFDGPPPVLRGPRPVRESKKEEAQVRRVWYPDAHQLFVGNIPHDVDDAKLKEFFEQYGTVLKLRMKSGGKVPNFCFVAFSDSASVQHILSKRPIQLRDDVYLNVEPMKTREPHVEGARYPDAHRLFVGNIPYDVQEAELKTFFEQYGTVLRVSIKSGGKVLNCGFVAFSDSAPVQSILSNRPIKLRGDWRLNVEEWKTCSARSDKADSEVPRQL